MASIFTKIVNGEIPCYKVAESEHFLAFLDIAPNTIGHTLCIPKKETDYIFDIEDQEYLDLMIFSKKVALALKSVVPCKRIGVSVIGLEVPHAHIHLIPLTQGISEMSFQQKVKTTPEELSELAKKIQDAFNNI